MVVRKKVLKQYIITSTKGVTPFIIADKSVCLTVRLSPLRPTTVVMLEKKKTKYINLMPFVNRTRTADKMPRLILANVEAVVFSGLHVHRWLLDHLRDPAQLDIGVVGVLGNHDALALDSRYT